jgi:hypothetical protein
VATKKKPVIENKEPTNKHSVFSFMHRKEKPPGTFDIGKFDYVNLKAGSVKFKSLYGRNSL